MEPRRLDIIIPVMRFWAAGGYRVLSNVATEWCRMGHRVRFMCHVDNTSPPYFPTEADVLWVDDDGEATTYPPPAGANVTPHAHPIAELRRMHRALTRQARHADLILANGALTAWPVAFTRTRAVKGYYIQAYETAFFEDAVGRMGTALRFLARWSYALPLRQVVNAPIYTSYPGIRTQKWVPPGLDMVVFHPQEAARPARPFVMGCVGRQEGWKGTSVVLEAFERLRASGDDVRLRVAYSLPAGQTAGEGVELVKPTNDAELAHFYRSLDVQVAPATIQLGAAHYPVMEPMACGVPVVTTGYLPATAENAWIVPVNDADAIARAVRSIRDDPAETARRVALGLEVVGAFGWPTVAARLLDAIMGEGFTVGVPRA